MEKIEMLEVDLKDLENAQTNVIEAMNNISEVEGLDDEYKQLDLILNSIDEAMSDIRVNLRILNELEEEDREENSRSEADCEAMDRDYDDYIFENMED